MISDIFIDRPRLAFVVSIVITLAGVLAITAIPLAQYPDIVSDIFNVLQSTLGGFYVNDFNLSAALGR